jgi:hypothetical protein
MIVFHIHTEGGEYAGIFCGILSAPHNIIMNLNNVMFAILFIHCQGEGKKEK